MIQPRPLEESGVTAGPTCRTGQQRNATHPKSQPPNAAMGSPAALVLIYKLCNVATMLNQLARIGYGCRHRTALVHVRGTLDCFMFQSHTTVPVRNDAGVGTAP